MACAHVFAMRTPYLMAAEEELKQAMSWNAMTYEGKDTVLRVVRDQAESFFTLAGVPETWPAR